MKGNDKGEGKESEAPQEQTRGLWRRGRPSPTPCNRGKEEQRPDQVPAKKEEVLLSLLSCWTEREPLLELQCSGTLGRKDILPRPTLCLKLDNLFVY